MTHCASKHDGSTKQIRPGLSHADLFTAGDAVRRVIPDYERYADKFGVWQRDDLRKGRP